MSLACENFLAFEDYIATQILDDRRSLSSVVEEQNDVGQIAFRNEAVFRRCSSRNRHRTFERTAKRIEFGRNSGQTFIGGVGSEFVDDADEGVGTIPQLGTDRRLSRVLSRSSGSGDFSLELSTTVLLSIEFF